MSARIHVVARDALSAGRLAEMLRASGYLVTLGDAPDVAAVDAADADVVVLCPASGGADEDDAAFAEQVRTRLGLPVLLCVASGQPPPAPSPGGLYRAPSLSEPIEPRELGPAIAAALRNHTLARRAAQAEQSLRESEQRQRAILDHIPDPAWLKDREGHYLAANRAWCELYGIAPDAYAGRTDAELLPPEVAAKLAREDRQLAESGATLRIESRDTDAEGNIRWFETVKAPVQDPGGQVTGIVGIARDMTRRQQMEDALRSSTMRFLAVWEQSIDGMRLTDAEGRILAVNEAYCRLVGRTRTMLEGRLFPVVYGNPVPDDAQQRLERYRQRFARREMPERQERRFTFADGRTLDVELSNSFLDLGGGQTALLAVFRDVTRRRRAEDALRFRSQAESLLAQITARFMNLPAAAIDQGIDDALREVGALFEVDRAYVCLHDAGRATAGKSHEWCAPGIAPQGERLQQLATAADPGWAARLRALELVIVPSADELPPEAAAERELLARQGIRALLLMPITIRSRTMGVIGFDQVARPRAWSADLVALTRLLAHVIANALERKRLEQDRERLIAELNRKHAELEHLVYVTSHDLRTPMLNIQGFALRLDDACRSLAGFLASPAPAESDRAAAHALLTQRMPDAVNYVLASIDRMDRLIEALLRLSRLGRAELQLGPVEVDAVVTGILDTVAFRLQETDAHVEVQPLPPCHGDPGQISQLFSNLIDNAIKYRDPGRPLQLRISGRVEDGQAFYQVADNGIGIAPEHRDKIWQVFFRAAPRGPIAGDGIGLNLARRIAERHGGEITLESTPGKGSCFQVRLPTAPPARPAGAAPPTQP